MLRRELPSGPSPRAMGAWQGAASAPIRRADRATILNPACFRQRRCRCCRLEPCPRHLVVARHPPVRRPVHSFRFHANRERVECLGCGFPPTSTTSAPGCGHRFRGSIPGPRVPLSRFAGAGLPRRRMTRGRCGSLLLQRFGHQLYAPAPALIGVRRSLCRRVD